MRKMFIAALMLGSSLAYARPNTLAMSCAEAYDLVMANGAVVLSTGEYTYDRFVAHQGFCELGEETEAAWVPTADDAQCFIGYTCKPDDNRN